MKTKALSLVALVLIQAASSLALADTHLKFDFGSGPAAPGYTRVGATAAYTSEIGYGFLDPKAISDVDRKTTDPLTSDFCTAAVPFTS